MEKSTVNFAADAFVCQLCCDKMFRVEGDNTIQIWFLKTHAGSTWSYGQQCTILRFTFSSALPREHFHSLNPVAAKFAYTR